VAAASIRRPAAPKVALSTASVYPESTATAFEIAGRLGYDGVEVMVWTDPVSQDVEALRRLSDTHGVPVLAVHAPCLLITQRVWSTDPWTKLKRARSAAERLGAGTVVVHPPFRWQRSYARAFVDGIWRMAGETDVRFAVENMFPWRYREREMMAYAPAWDPTEDDYRHFTIDLSHTATSRTDTLAMLDRMGDRLAHVHIADGSGSGKDEHLVPGRGTQPCAELLGRLGESGSAFDGTVVVEVNTRRAMSAAERETDLAEALAYTRRHLTPPASAPDDVAEGSRTGTGAGHDASARWS
jgi:sugar phosphate isomerase/epimerase